MLKGRTNTHIYTNGRGGGGGQEPISQGRRKKGQQCRVNGGRNMKRGESVALTGSGERGGPVKGRFQGMAAG